MKQAIILIFAASMIIGCGSKTDNKQPKDSEPVTEVNTVHPAKGSISSNIELLATTGYLRHWVVTAPVNAYVTGTFAQTGQSVRAGQKLFSIETKERQALGNDMPGSGNLGRMNIHAPQNGVLTDVFQQPGCYVQEGTQLATMADPGSLVFKIDVPYESMKYVKHGSPCSIILPDGTILNGRIDTQLASMTESSQSLQVTARAKAPFLPEGMNVKVRINTGSKGHGNMVLPKSAVQSNEDMTEFWIMKADKTGHAEKITVTTGTSNETNIEIVSPVLSLQDEIITTGSYGLENGARIKVTR